MESWSLYIDGASNVNGTGLGLVLKSPQKDTLAYSICCEFKATNNESEYEALIIGLTTVVDMKIAHIKVNCDSLLIVNHIKGEYEAKDCKMSAYLEIVKELQGKFDSFSIQQIPREQNSHADALAGLGDVLKKENVLTIPVIHILEPATIRAKKERDVTIMAVDNHEERGSWTQKYKDYITKGEIPKDNEAKSLKIKATRFTIIDGILFKKSVTGLLQRCLEESEANDVLRDIHEGDYGNHSGGRSLSCKVLRMGYYWPTLK
ncbi:uncharacterized protein LOC141685096 [Apium graveolens]|uniref:uncharacterized protein LOC141685096 n=1 Tax=Apium graveolens TaxID=4045 RepID=UPI003D7BE897